jgi:hypothetical protein
MRKRDITGKFVSDPIRQSVKESFKDNITYLWYCKKCKSETNHYMCDDKCKPCRQEYTKSPEVYKRQRSAEMLKDYGITTEDWTKMYEEQGGKCILPSCNFTHHDRWYDQGTNGLHIDHDHKTGEVRGLMCPDHNKSLGKVEKDRTIFYEMIDYLDHHNEKVSNFSSLL